MLTTGTDNNVGVYQIDEANYKVNFKFFKALQVSPSFITIVNFQIAVTYQAKIQKLDLTNLVTCFSNCSTCYGSSSTECGTCKSGYYYDPSLSACQLCIAPCLICSSKKICQSCQSGYYLDSSGNCSQCSIGCSQCNSSGCTLCSDIKATVNTLNVCECQTGFYLDSTGVCLACSLGCKSCDQAGCLTCNDSKALTDSNNICVCQDGYYMDSNGVCQTCNKTCLTCSSQNVCTSCDPLIQYRQLDSLSKTCLCLPGYTQVASQNNCQQCPSSCLTCSSLTVCQTCKNGFYLNSSKSCVACDVGCSSCDLSGCLLCSDNKAKPNSSNICVCQNGYFLDNIGVCQTCNVGCSKCDQTGCLLCSDSNASPSKNNICTCKDGYYYDSNNVCQLCNSTCKTCSNKNVCTQCDSLVQFRQLDNSTNTCVCKQGYTQVSGSDICQLTNQSCQVSNCQSCSNISVCTQCQSSYYLFINSCVSSCPQGYEINSTNQCILIVKIYYQITAFELNKFMIQFDQKLTNVNLFSSRIQVDVSDFSGKYTFYTQVVSDNTIIIVISPNSVTSAKNYTVTFNFDQSTQSHLFTYTQQVSGQLDYQPSESTKQATKTIGEATQAASKATVASLLPLAISGNFQLIATAVDISQLIYLMNFINIEQIFYQLMKNACLRLKYFLNQSFPYNLDQFYDSVKDIKVPFKNFFELIEDFHEVEYKSPEKFEIKEVQSFYLENFGIFFHFSKQNFNFPSNYFIKGDIFSLIITILMTNFIIYLVEMGMRIKPSWQKHVNSIRKKIFTVNFYFEFLFVIFLELTIALILQFQQLQYNHHVSEIVNFILLILGFFISLFPFLLVYLIYHKKITSPIKMLEESSNYEYYYPIQFFRKYYYSIVIGGFGFSPLSQLICLNIWNIFMLGLLIKKQPSKHKSYNYKDIISSCFFLSSTTLLFLFMLPQFSSEDTQMQLGWIVVCNYILIILLELGFFIKEALTEIFEFIRKAKEKLKKKQEQIASNKVVPMSPTSIKQNVQNICEDSAQKDQTQEYKINTKKPPLCRPGVERPKIDAIKYQNSNSTHDVIEKQENSVFNDSPIKTQRPSPLPSSSNLRGNSSTFNLIPSGFQKSSSYLRPPSLQYDKRTNDQQSLDYANQIHEINDVQKLKVIDKDMASSERVLISSPENKLKSFVNNKSINALEKSISGHDNGLEFIPMIQSSEFLKNFTQEQHPTDRKRIERPQFNKSNTNGRKRVMQKLKSFHENIKEEK